jgi:hypothetical protein
MTPPHARARQAVAGLALGAAGILYSRFGGRKTRPAAGAEDPGAREPEGPAPTVDLERSVTPTEIGRARAELAQELARRAGQR